MMKIMLINGYRVGRPVLPTGIGYVAQAIENAGFDFNVCDINLHTNDQIVQMIKDGKPQYVGCGTLTHDVEKNYELLQAIHDAIPHAIIILGGPHAIAAGNKIFMECPIVDIVIQGEGEEAVVKLLQGVPGSSIPGVLVKDSKNEAVHQELLNINKIAFPKYNKFDLDKYGNTMNLASSRGCVYNCSFCGAPRFLGNKWRAFKLERMVEEFEYWYGKGYRQFYFSDSLFALNKKRVIDFCTYIVKSGYSEIVFTADGVRADHLTFEILQYMKKAYFKSITLGVESVNDETLMFFNKGETFRQIDYAISAADSLGFDISVYLIIGAPEESYDDAVKSIMYPMKYKNIRGSIVSKLTPIMGTQYYDYAIAQKLVNDKSVYYPKQEVYGTNERFDTQNAVEEMWESLHPTIAKMSNFLTMRNQIVKALANIGFGSFNIGVRTLNMLTRISLNPVALLFIKALTYLKDKWLITSLFGLVKAFSIKSHMTQKERVKLFRLSKYSINIIEIGSYIGASTCCFGAALKKYGSGKVFCIDTWNNDAMTEGKRDTWHDFQNNTAGYKKFIVPIRGSSIDVVDEVAARVKSLDLLFIDGDHSYAGVKADWDAYKRFLRPGSIIVFHDSGWAEGVKRVIQEDVILQVSSSDSLPNMWWGIIK